MKDLELLSRHYNFTTRQKERIQDLAKDIAIGFNNYLCNNKWHRNGKSDEWYQIPKQNENKTQEQLFNEYLNTLK